MPNDGIIHRAPIWNDWANDRKDTTLNQDNPRTLKRAFAVAVTAKDDGRKLRAFMELCARIGI